MTNKNIITFAICILLASSAELGMKHKIKKDKEQIKKELNTVLLPNAERKLDSLILTRSMLRDSITYFQHELKNQTKYTQLKEQIPIAQDICTDLESLSIQWHREYAKTEDAIANYADSTQIPTALLQRLSYLTDSVVSTPVMNNQRFDFISENLQNTLESYISCFDYHNPDNIESEYEIIDGIYTTLCYVKDLFFAIDNSQNIFDKKQLKNLGQKTDKAITEFCKMQSENQTQYISKKLYLMKRQKDTNNYALKEHMKKVAGLRSKFAVDSLYKVRKNKNH
jgi:hypothetical protein